MPFKSKLRRREFVIDDNNYQRYVAPPPGIKKGYKRRNWEANPLGEGFAAKLNIPIIPRDEWDDRIAEMEREKSRLSDIMRDAKIPVKYQARTNYCWINAPVWATEVVRELQGETYVSLSPASCGAIIKNYANVGGWGTEGLEFIAKSGIAPSELWPDATIARKYDNADSQRERVKYRITEWDDVPPRNFDLLMTLLFNRRPVPIGLNWWRHEVTAMDPVKPTSRTYGVRFANSWDVTYGDDGYGILSESKATPDDACCPRVAIAA